MSKQFENPVEVGAEVSGIYCGTLFAGTVNRTRMVTTNYRIAESLVILSAPVTVHGTERDELLIHTGHHGEPEEGWGDDWMQVR